MTAQNGPGKMPPDSPPLYHEVGLLEQFNLPPHVIRFIRAHQRQLWRIFACVVALALLVAGIDAYRNHRQIKAAEALDAALQAESGQREQLAQVSKKYSSTPSALWAEVTLAQLDEEEKKISEAIKRYQSILAWLKPDSQLEPLIRGKLAGLEEQQKNWSAALAHYEVLGKQEDYAAESRLGMARMYEALGQKERALARYKKFVELTAVSTAESGEDPRRQLVLAHLELLQEQETK